MTIGGGLVFRLFRQTLSLGSFRVLLASFFLATATIVSIDLYQRSLEAALVAGSSELLAGDLQLVSSQPVSDSLRNELNRTDVRTAESWVTRSMLVAGEEMQLVTVKAVNDHYPLKGKVAWKGLPGATQPVHEGKDTPSVGEIWLNERLFDALKVAIGDEVQLGRIKLRVARVLIREADVQGGLSAFAPWVMVRLADLQAAGLIQPGSRATYISYLAGDKNALAEVKAAVEKKLLPGQRLQGLGEGSPRVSRALDKAKTYLSLGGSLGLILAVIAIVYSTREFASGQTRQIGLLKALGCRHATIRRLYLAQMAVGGGFTWLAGVLAGGLVFELGVTLLGDVSQLKHVWQLGADTVLFSVFFSLGVCMLSAGVVLFPVLSSFRQVSPMVVLRTSTPETTDGRWKGKLLMIGLGFLFLLYGYIGQFGLLASLVSGLLILLGFSVLLVRGFVAVFLWIQRMSWFPANMRFPWQLVLTRLSRTPFQTALQVFSVSIVIMVVSLLVSVRSTLLGEWHASLPVDAPNHFLINIAPEEAKPLAELLSRNDIEPAGIYPMVRGRLVSINGKPVQEVVPEADSIGALNRELNLTWSASLPSHNQVVSGRWWDAHPADPSQTNALVSLESGLAARLNVKLNDQLRFLIGDQAVDARLANLREVQWESMQPNFYAIFSPGALDRFPYTSITSIYLSPEKKVLVTELQRQFPTMTVLEVDQIIDRIQQIIARVTGAVELILGLVSVGACLALLAIINASVPARMKEGVIIRALGGQKSLLSSLHGWEYLFIALVASAWGVFCAELTYAILVTVAFDVSPTLHWLHFPVGFVLVGGLVSWVAWLRLRVIGTIPPYQALRS